MTLEQLRIFVAVAEREHVTLAARALNLTQSAVSNAIAALEARHGVRLFDRVGRGVTLNEAGRAFLPEARGVLAHASAAEAALTDLAGLRRGRLVIAASQTIASYWLPEHLVRFHAAYPGVQLDVSMANTRDVAAAVREGAAELGFVEGEVDDPALSHEVVGVDRLVLLVARGHPWAAKARLRLVDFTSELWLLRELGSGTRSSLEAALQALGVEPNALPVGMTLPSNEALLAAAAAGAGVTALSGSVAAAALATGRLQAANLRLRTREFRLLRHKERYRSRAGDAFVTSLRI